jgi:broad specificity phosphatase PhoE
LVILVRHAEKAAEPHEDPPLTSAGRERARALAATLADAGVTDIVTSDRLRTRETAAPIAKARHLQPVEIGRPEGSLDRHVAAVVAEVRRHPGGVVLVVGHTDTVPAIVRALGGPSIGTIADAEYDNLFMMTSGPEGWRLVRARYGAPGRGN